MLGNAFCPRTAISVVEGGAEMIVFDEILRMRQKELKHYLAGYLKKMGYDVIRQKGFLYARGNRSGVAGGTP